MTLLQISQLELSQNKNEKQKKKKETRFLCTKKLGWEGGALSVGGGGGHWEADGAETVIVRVGGFSTGSGGH